VTPCGRITTLKKKNRGRKRGRRSLVAGIASLRRSDGDIECPARGRTSIDAGGIDSSIEVRLSGLRARHSFSAGVRSRNVEVVVVNGVGATEAEEMDVVVG